MKVAMVGATGMVGQVMLDVLSERNFKIDELILVASERSVGKQIKVQDKTQTIKSLAEAVEAKPDIALFSAGGNTSLEWAPKFAAVGTKVIDNSSAWRMHKDYKLIIPEINAGELTSKDFIIANPNCSTIQLLMVLKPLHDKFNIKRVVVSTYQSITGTGLKAVKQLEAEAKNQSVEMAYPYQIHKNVLPHCDVFLENDYTKEEMKLTNETKKILGDQNVNLVATAVRIPVVGGHSESVNIEFEDAFDIATVKQILNQMPGVTLQDNPDVNTYPMPIYAEGKDDVFVGRIRRDFTLENGLNLWIVADNLRKGAATNAIQIAEYLVDHKLV